MSEQLKKDNTPVAQISLFQIEIQKRFERFSPETSLTAATREAGKLEYNVAPGPFWTFEGEVLRDIYNKTYVSPE